MEGYLSVQEIADCNGTSARAVQLGIDRGKYSLIRQVSGKGRGGRAWQIHINDPAISEAARTQYCITNNTALPAVPVEPEIIDTPSPSGSASAIPDKVRKVALARLDLLRVWEEYRSDGHTKTTAADKEFEAAYNNGTIFKDLYELIGKVSVKTLYRWKAILDGTTDYKKLAPQYFTRKTGVPKLSEEEKIAFMGFLLKPNKIKIGSAYRLTKFYLDKQGMPTDKSAMTFRRFADHFKAQHYDRWVLMREGQKALKDKVEPYIKRDPSLLEVGDVLVADGHRLNFQVINPFTGKPCRATLVGYIDWKSYDLMGYEIMIEENTQCIASALRNSIIRLGKMPKISYQDNGRAFRSRFFTSIEKFEESGIYGLFSRLGIVPLFATPYNARAKVIERWFKEFSDTFERLLPSFIGASISDKPAWMMRNEKLHKALHNEYVPTIEEANSLIESWLMFHRAQPCPHVQGKSIGQVFEEGRGSGVELHELDDLMMDMKRKNIDRNGIRLFGNHYYNQDLYGFREPVVIRYSLFDLSYIKIYRTDGDFLCTANRVQSVHPVAQYLGTAQDVEAVKQGLAMQKRLGNSTVKTVKKMLKTGRPIEVDWQKVVEITPGVIDRLEQEDIELPPVERRIPDEMLIAHDEISVNVQSGNSNGVFESGWERYEFLHSKEELTDDERRWIYLYEAGKVCPGEFNTIYKEPNNIAI